MSKHSGPYCIKHETSEACDCIKLEASAVALSDGLACPTMEDCQYVQWLAGDKQILAEALKEIYSIRGEDEDLAKIINEALDRGSAG